MIETDPKRTNLKAVKLNEWPDELDDNLGPGSCYRVDELRFGFTCPGCGRFGAIKAANPKPAESPSWLIKSGSLDEPTSLTLEPSINCIGCCGWHGYLTNGLFVSC